MKNPDAIIIGAGIVGACSALSLTNAGLRVLVLDRASVASGTTGAGEGNILVSDKDPGPELTLALRSRDLWFELQDDVGDCFELEAKGGVVIARRDDSALMTGVNRFITLAQTFKPDLVFIACGADGHLEDPLTNLEYSVAGYVAVAHKVRDTFPKMPILMGGAGGYLPDTRTPELWAAFARELVLASH